MKSISSSFLNTCNIFKFFNLSGKLTVFIIWLIISVSGLMNIFFILLINLVDNPSNPKLVFGDSLLMI